MSKRRRKKTTIDKLSAKKLAIVALILQILNTAFEIIEKMVNALKDWEIAACTGEQGAPLGTRQS